jgi:hypothetical protein
MATKDPNKKVKAKTEQRKYWQITSADDSRKKLEFFPLFVVNDETKEVECRNLDIRYTDERGKQHTMLFDWLNIFMFVYYTANEELRQQLASRYERKVNYVPYELTIPVTPEDAKVGNVKRRVELPIDELTMAIAREEAWKIFLRNKGKIGDPRAFTYKKK